MALLDVDRLAPFLPPTLRRRLSTLTEAAGIAREVHSGRVLAGMMPSVARGMLLELGRTKADTSMISGHAARFRWDYDSDFPELRALYRKAKQSQWDADTAIDWSRDVDPLDPERALIPRDFFDVPGLAALGVRLDDAEQRRFTHSMAAWMLSQFLHGEQGALYAAAQITEAVGWMDAKLYGATQVMDEGRHLETFHRYLAEKLDKIYVINDNLFVILDALMTDPRWDVKFLGMQIMVEGLALGAFGTLYRITKEPLLRELLGYVIRDEARHVTFGVHALRRHFAELDEAERRDREDWAFEVALLMRNRFLAHEVFEEWFEGRIRRTQWNALVSGSPGMREFRSVMFARLVPNLRTIGLLSERMRRHYGDAGLLQYYDGADALSMGGDELLASLDRQPSDD
jgi:hypothetical protein